jgi:hypothetical protein
LKKEAFDANERHNRSVEGLSNELDHAYQLESRLQVVQNECSEECKNAEVTEAEKEKLKAKVERLEAEKTKAVKA